MPTLLELQRDFLAAILDGGAIADGRVLARGIDPARRLSVYANTARTNFIESLHLGFPVTLRLVGAEYFDQCANAYRASHPSRSGDLNAAGQAFPGFLAELHAGGDHRYLGDVARLEWLCQESLMAADPPRLDAARFFERLAAVAPARYDGLRFALHPAARLFSSDYPASEIFNANLGDEEPPLIDLSKGGERLLIVRCEVRDTHTLDFHPLTAGEYAFMHALDADTDFAAAMERADTDGSGFDAVAALRRFIAAGAIVDFDGDLT
jgi:hypothetical protein